MKWAFIESKPLIGKGLPATLNQRVLGSSPSAPTTPIKHLGGRWGCRVRPVSAACPQMLTSSQKCGQIASRPVSLTHLERGHHEQIGLAYRRAAEGSPCVLLIGVPKSSGPKIPQEPEMVIGHWHHQH